MTRTVALHDLMRRVEPQEPGALGEPGKQGPRVACQPAIEGPIAHAFERVEQPQHDHLAGPEVRIRMCGHGAQLLIDLREQGGDKIHSRHTALLSAYRWHPAQRGRIVGRLQDQKPLLLVCKVLEVLYSLPETNTIGYYYREAA